MEATISSPPLSVCRTKGALRVSWDPSISSVAGYRVYRDDGSGYSPLSAIIPELIYTDSSVNSGSTYHYVVTAVDSNGNESDYSNEATAVVPNP